MNPTYDPSPDRFRVLITGGDTSISNTTSWAGADPDIQYSVPDTAFVRTT